MNVPASTSPFHRGSSDRAPHWRAAISLASSIALHAALLILFLRPQLPAAPAGASDVVTVYLRDSRRSSPPPAPQLARATARRADPRPDPAESAEPPDRTIAPVRGATSKSGHGTVAGKPARATDRTPEMLSRTADVSRSKPLPVDQQGNRARDSSALYLRELAERLSQVRHYPQLAVALHEEGTVLLSFQIDRDGRLLAWNIASSSGHDDLDREVGRMVAEAAPFPPFPPSWHQSEKVFRVPIGFYLH